MTIFQMLGQSGLLTLLGMAVVFAFIIILIVCMNVLYGVVHALRLDKDEVKPVSKPAAKVSAKPVPAAVNAAVDKKAIIAAIAMAVHEKENN